jgi:DNA-binding transcriptional ArsR family regulator
MKRRSLDHIFAALADPTRRAILARLARGESTVTELAAPHRISLPAISKHLRVLERAGLLARRRDGRVHRCRLVGAPLGDAATWLVRYSRFWEQQFDALARYLEHTTEEGGPAWPQSSSVPIPSLPLRERLRRPERRSSKRGRSRRT